MSGCCTPEGSCHTTSEAGGGVATAAAVTTVYSVTGMTCGHCVQSVTKEVSALDGVESVDVDLATGRVTVVSAAEPDDAAVGAAVDEAGYELAGRTS